MLFDGLRRVEQEADVNDSVYHFWSSGRGANRSVVYSK